MEMERWGEMRRYKYTGIICKTKVNGVLWIYIITEQ